MLEGIPEVFYDWLRSEDIVTLENLAEAVSDDKFVRSDMQQAGLKGFKRGAFKKEVQAAAADVSSQVTSSSFEMQSFKTAQEQQSTLPKNSFTPVEAIGQSISPVVARAGRTNAIPLMDWSSMTDEEFKDLVLGRSI